MERPYQVTFCGNTLHEWESVRSTLGVAPTGTGKSHIIAAVIKAVFPKRVMVLSYRKEIILQLAKTIERETGYEVGIEMGDIHTHAGLFGHKQVIVSTVQTQFSKNGEVRRMIKFPPGEFEVLIVDETHHVVSPTSKMVVDYYKQNPKLKVLGLTATPDRHDQQALRQIFDSVAFDYEILDAIEDGWLVYPKQQMATILGLDYSHIHTTAGDLNGGELAMVMEQEKNILGVADTTLQVVGSMRTIVFTASVAQAEAICTIFNRYKPGCAGWVHGGTPSDARKVLLEEFQNGDVQIVCNCDVLTEGYDNPGVEAIAMAAPTKSRGKYAQRCGRSLRPLPGLVDNLLTSAERKEAIASSSKPQALILDFVGNSGKHKLMTTADILGGREFDEEARKRAQAKAVAMNQPCKLVELMEDEQKKLEAERAKAEERRAKDRARRASLRATAQFSLKQVDAFDDFDRDQAEPDWNNGRHLSPKQLAMLKRNGIDASALPYNEAQRQLIALTCRLKKRPCTDGQASVLRRYDLDPQRFTKQGASQMIDKIKNNGWKLPNEAQAILKS